MFGVNVKQIVEGHVNELLGREQELSQSRLKICKKCSLYSDVLGGLCDSKKCWNTLTQSIAYAPGTDIICGCGCRLASKTTLPNAKCVLSKW